MEQYSLMKDLETLSRNKKIMTLAEFKKKRTTENGLQRNTTKLEARISILQKIVKLSFAVYKHISI